MRVPAAAAVPTTAVVTPPPVDEVTPSPAVTVPVATGSSWMALSNSHTVTRAPDAASWAATPMATAEAPDEAATVPLPETTTTLPPVTAPEVVSETGWMPPE
jgi:hypothetical protein